MDSKYTLRAWQVSYLPELFTGFAKTADKVGCAHPTYKVGPSVTNQKGETTFEATFSFPEQIGFKGHTFAGVVDHLEGGNVGCFAEKDADYAVRDGVCDHCNKKRSRSQTIVTRFETGEYFQLGKQCAKHYLGHDLFGKLLKFLFPSEEEFSEEGEFFGFRSPKTFEVEWTVANAIAVFQRHGFSPSSFGPTSTANRVHFNLFPWPQRNTKPADRLEYVDVTDAHVKEAKKLLKWVATQSSNSGYMVNLKAVCVTRVIGVKHLGLLASIVSAKSHADRKVQAEKDRVKALKAKTKAGTASEFIGTVGERLTLTGIVERVHAFESDFGTSYLVAFKVGKDAVNSFVSGTSAFLLDDADNFIKVGDSVTFKGTVKAHKVFREENQTQLTRLARV